MKSLLSDPCDIGKIEFEGCIAAEMKMEEVLLGNRSSCRVASVVRSVENIEPRRN